MNNNNKASIIQHMQGRCLFSACIVHDNKIPDCLPHLWSVAYNGIKTNLDLFYPKYF